jgi:very-short-patch-repair endonuclease
MTTPKQRARELRRNSTKAETLLWAQLRDRRLNGYKFRRQHPIGPFFADFACIEHRLVVELDGESHDWTYERDAARARSLARDGYRVLRIPNEEVRTNLDGVVQTILNTLDGALG